jgi:hypothetical protein
MAWTPALEAEEKVIVDVYLRARDGVYFGLLLSDRQLCYLKAKTGLVMSDPWETVALRRSDVTFVKLVLKRAWFLRVLGVGLILLTWSYVLAFIFGPLGEFHFGVLLGFALGGACLTSSNNRWSLAFRSAGKRHQILQPVSSSKEVVAQMAEALQKTGRELSLP